MVAATTQAVTPGIKMFYKIPDMLSCFVPFVMVLYLTSTLYGLRRLSEFGQTNRILFGFKTGCPTKVRAMAII